MPTGLHRPQSHIDLSTEGRHDNRVISGRAHRLRRRRTSPANRRLLGWNTLNHPNRQHTFGTDSTAGLEAFSHLEIIFRFHLTDPTDLNLGARRPRDNPDWPEVGIFGHRNMRRVNWLGVSRCRLLKVDGLDLQVEDLDAVDGTPVLDIKPWFNEMGPRGEIRQPSWTTEMLERYYAPHGSPEHQSLDDGS